MARKSTGSIVEHQGKDGTTYYAIRFRAYGQRQYVALGPVTSGVAERQLRHTLADVERGIWQANQPTAAPPAPAGSVTFHEYAEQWWVEREPEWAAKTRTNYRGRLEAHLLPFFKDHELAAITIAEVDRYKAHKLAEAERCKAARGAAIARGEKYDGPRGLGATSINKTLVLLSAILETAEERELITRNPAWGKRRRVRARAPRRTYLDTAGQIDALLGAAGVLDEEARVDRKFPRRAILATLAFSGLRIGEALELRWGDVDLAVGRLRIGKAKTDAGTRDVPLLPALRDELAVLKASAVDLDPSGYVFPTAKGRRQSASHVRSRVLARAVDRANKQLEEADEIPLPTGLTPHSMRRTYASVLYALGTSPVDVQAAMGHSTPFLSQALYARAMRIDGDEKGRLRALVDGVEWADPGRRGDEASVTDPDQRHSDRADARS